MKLSGAQQRMLERLRRDGRVEIRRGDWREYQVARALARRGLAEFVGLTLALPAPHDDDSTATKQGDGLR